MLLGGVLLASGCSAVLESGSQSASMAPTEVPVASSSSGSPTIAELPPGRVVAADQIMFSEDMRTLRLSFVGAREWSAEDPACTADYAGSAVDAGEILEVAVVETVELRPGGLTPDGHVIECDLVGYGREVVVELPAPFGGSSVRNLDGQSYPLASIDEARLYEIPESALPAGWSLQLTVSLLDSVPPFPSFRTYSPVDLPDVDDPQLRMIQYFESVAGQGPQGTGIVTRIDIQGSTGFLVEKPDGGVLVSWNSPSGDPITLVTTDGALSADELVAAARATRLIGSE